MSLTLWKCRQNATSASRLYAEKLRNHSEILQIEEEIIEDGLNYIRTVFPLPLLKDTIAISFYTHDTPWLAVYIKQPIWALENPHVVRRSYYTTNLQ